MGVVEWSILGNKEHFCGEISLFGDKWSPLWALSACGQILQKIPGRGQTPPHPMHGFGKQMVRQPIPKWSFVRYVWSYKLSRQCVLIVSSICQSFPVQNFHPSPIRELLPADSRNGHSGPEALCINVGLARITNLMDMAQSHLWKWWF